MRVGRSVVLQAFGTRRIGVSAIVFASLALTACAASIIRNPVPQNLVEQAEPAGFGEIRTWGDVPPKGIDRAMAVKVRQTRKHRPKILARGRNATLSYLAISGGGGDGAFGAGLLAGWTTAGTRPEFDIVTGVSTGALIAPFAFLGSDYDRQLREVYTKYSTKQLVEPQILSALFGGAAVADNSELAQLIARYVDRDVMGAVAREHNRGRRLLVGTTNLDAQRPVIWNMGRIANSDNPTALELFRKVLLASAAIPGLFPPVLIKVKADGKQLEEMHVDGGTTGQVFFLPGQLNLKRLERKYGVTARNKLYVIRNSKTAPAFEPVRATTMQIASRSIATLIHSQSLGDLLRLYDQAKSNGIDYNLASVPEDFNVKSNEPFDLEYMTALFDLGRELGAGGYKWAKTPPGVAARR